MKRYIKSSYEEDFQAELAKLTSARDKANYLREVIEEAGVDEHDILLHFFDYLPQDTVVEVLEDLVNEIGLFDEEY